MWLLGESQWSRDTPFSEKSSKPGVKPSPFIAFAKVKRAFFVYISQSVPTVPVARSVFEIYLKNR